MTIIPMILAAAIPAFYTYEQFGAKGDGVTDDREAIIAAHAAANRFNRPVRATDGKTYYIAGDRAYASVRTDVDFGTAKFIIDDTNVKNINSPLFHIESEPRSYAVTGVVSLASGQTNLGVRLPCKSIVHVQNSKKRQYIRLGPNRDGGSVQQEVLLVDEDGTIDGNCPLIWNYDRITRIVADPVDTTVLTVKGGVFVTRANRAESKYTYYNRGIVVMRSNVIVEGLRHEITGELDHGAPYGGFLTVSDCANVLVTNCTFSAHKTYMTIGSGGVPVPMGSYDLSANRALNVSYVNCRQLTDIRDRRYWGIFGSNYCKNLLLDGCEFSRFDAHKGVANAVIRNSNLGYMGVHAIGAGKLLIENTKVYADYFVELRPDYGSTWDGDIVIRNCELVPSKGGHSFVFTGSNDGHHDFGYQCRMARSIEIDGFVFDDSHATGNGARHFLFANFNSKFGKDAAPAKYPYVLPDEVRVSNIRTAKGGKIGISPNEKMFGGVNVVGLR